MARLTIPVHLRWSDVDGYQHVNNAKMFTILEETRIAAFWASTPGDALMEGARAGGDTGVDDPTAAEADRDPDEGETGPVAPPAAAAANGTPGTKVLATGPGSGTNTYIARQEIEYLAPLPYTLKPLQVQLWISHLGGASIDICYEIPGPDGIAVRAMTTLVLIDEASGKPRRMTEQERATWAPYLDEPVRFRRRPRDTDA
ncbi:acyl-CoA thioesterase [Georgenia sp. AZ-5]|uniref:acyl-CoA thioesterase n=1 Tax=Georgenia sp. AZ-5 TaxID=3367526 RepID=UPI00375419CA